jgi:hypothetical protein
VRFSAGARIFCKVSDGSCMLASSRTACAIWRKRLAAAVAPSERGRAVSSAFILAIVTHWRTLMSSGQASVQRALPSQALSHFIRPPAAAPPRVSADNSPTRAFASPASSPISRAVGQASKHLPQPVQRSAASAAKASSLSA